MTHPKVRAASAALDEFSRLARSKAIDGVVMMKISDVEDMIEIIRGLIHQVSDIRGQLDAVHISRALQQMSGHDEKSS